MPLRSGLGVSFEHMPPRLSAADLLTLVRLPLAVAFVAIDSTQARLIVLVAAALTDFSDGWVARRYGASRIGAVLDPVADKLFMAAAFGVVLFSGALSWYEVVLALLRDIVATAAVAVGAATGGARTVSARAGGKFVTALQLVALLAFLLGWPILRPLAWMIGGAAVYALLDYSRIHRKRVEAS